MHETAEGRTRLILLLLPLAHMVAFWPLGGWYFRRMTGAAGEPWALLPLLTMLFIAWQQRDRRLLRAGTPPAAFRSPWLAIACVCTLIYAVAFASLPPLVRAGFAVTALTSTISVCWLGRPFHPGLWGLALMSLPIMATVDFYAGYPLRVIVAHLAAWILRGSGVPVAASGAILDWNGTPVAVDVPCSGIRMLWAGAYIAIALACMYRLPGRKLAVVGALALAMIVLGNILRATVLFFIEAGLVPAQPWMHAGVGLVAFALTTGGLTGGVIRLRNRRDTVDALPAVAGSDSSPGIPDSRRVRILVVCALACAWCLAMSAPLWAWQPSRAPLGFTGWPATLEGRMLRSLPLTDAERRFQDDFPGRIGRFTDGTREIILRWIAQPSRQLHPAELCFKGWGYSVVPLPLLRGADGSCWGHFQARRGNEAFDVRGCVRDEDGRTWPDVSSWFWAAVLGRSRSPWLAITIAERAGNPETSEAKE